MNQVKTMAVAVLALAVAAAFAANKVKSKAGGVDLTTERGGGQVICTADFNDEMSIIRDAGTEVLVKGSCGQGWVDKSKLEYVARPTGDKAYTFNEFDIRAWIDNQTAFGVLMDDYEEFEGVKIDRDFREYLRETMDREQVERRHAEN